MQSNYSSNLNNESLKHGHHNCKQPEYYYEAVQINVNTSDYYMFSTESTLNTFGYLYEYPFDLYNSLDLSLSENDDSCETTQFQITAYLHFNITYVLIVTTPYDYMNEQGPFSVIVKGQDGVAMKPIGMHTHMFLLTSIEYFLLFKIVI